MFLAPAAQAAELAGTRLPSAREHYRQFEHYPMREHARLLVEACGVLFPQLSTRMALRKLGRAAPRALLTSTLGKVTLGATEGVESALRSLCDTYPLNVRPCRLEVLESSNEHFIVRLHELYYFLDCHHVGAFEGAMRHAGVKGQVGLRVNGAFEADFLCTWQS